MYEKLTGALSSSSNQTFISGRELRTPLTRKRRTGLLGGRSLEPDDDTTQLEQSLFILECVRSSPLFAGLSADPQRELCESAIERRFATREFIFREDDPIRFVDVIGTGSVKISHLSREGSEVILRVDRAGSPIDGMGDSSEKLHTTTACAVRDCSMVSWDASVFAGFVEQFPAIQRNATLIVKRRLKMLEQAFCDISTLRVPQRLARILLRLTDQDQCSTPESLGLSREELAQMIGTSPFTISRLLREWAERQIVYVSRNGVIIDDLQSLVRLAEETDGEDEISQIA